MKKNTILIKKEIRGDGMKKTLLLFLFGLLLIVSPLVGFAQGNEGLNEAPLEENSFYDDLITPMDEPCYYWLGPHQYVNGSSHNDWVYTKHDHEVEGVTLKDCTWGKYYRFTDQFCACGIHREVRTYIGNPKDTHTKY